MTMMCIHTFCSSFKVLASFRKQKNKQLLFQFFHLTQNLNHLRLFPLLAFPPSSQSWSILKSWQVFFSSIPRCLLFYSHSQPSSGTSSMVIFWDINIVYTLFLCCQSPVSIILWTVKMIQLGTLIRKADARSYSWQGQAQGVCQNCKTTSLEIGTEKIVFNVVSHGRKQIAWLGHI